MILSSQGVSLDYGEMERFVDAPSLAVRPSLPLNCDEQMTRWDVRAGILVVRSAGS